jgi:hypothetical protein
MKERLYGFFSQQAKEYLQGNTSCSKSNESLDRLPSSFFYLTPDGQTVEVTLMQRDNPELDRNSYFWPDTVAVGEITEQVRR